MEAVGLAYEEICQPKWFQEEPHLGWGFWNFCHEAYQATTPHEGYVRAREWGQRCPLGFFSFTSNIDSHWVASGTKGDNVLEVHGAVKWLQCSKPCAPDVWKAPKDHGLVEDPVTHRVQGILPTCPKCKAVARPNVQMFGGDSGFSKARRGAQFSRYDAWLKSLEARPDKGSLRVTCVELGCGLTVPTVRNELESVVKKFPEARIVRINPENPGLSTELASKGVSLPLKAGFAIEELSKQVFKEEDSQVTFILWGATGGCEVRAPYATCLGRLLRLCQMDEGLVIDFSKTAKASSWPYGGRKPLEIRLDQPVDTSCFNETKAGEGSQMQVTCVVEVEAAFLNSDRTAHYLNPTLLQRVHNVHALVEEMNRLFDNPAYQEQALKCESKKELMEHVRTVQYAVLPKYGIEASDKGTLHMTAFISSAQRVPEVQAQVDRSMGLSCVRLMGQLPAMSEKEKQKAAPEPMEVVCMAMPQEDGGESTDSLPLEVTVQTKVWELRHKLATTLKWDEDTARAVKFLSKNGNSFAGIKDTETVKKVLYLRNCPPLREAVLVEVTFREMAPEDGQAALTFPMSLMSDDTVSDLRQMLGDTLGWDPPTRKRAKFLIRVGKESFGGLKDHEQVQARKVIYVHGAPLVPTPEASAALEAARLADEAEGKGEREEEQEEAKGADNQEQEPGESAEEIEIEVVLDQALDFRYPVAVKRGCTILAVKRILSDADPTGRTKIDSFWLREPGAGNPSLPDSKRLCVACSLEISQEPPPRPPPRPVAVTRARARRSLEQSPTPAQAHRYFVAGSWTDYKPLEMDREGPCFVHTVKVGRQGWESFQILLEGNWDTTYYPSVRDANPDKDHKLKGPDSKGHGLNWTIGTPGGKGKDATKPGAHFKIVISVDDQERATKVSWRQVRG